MTDITERLVTCFAEVFPHLSAAEIRTATVESVEAWDSLAAVTLLALVEEEFGIEFDIGAVADLSSFDGFLALLEEKREFVGGSP